MTRDPTHPVALDPATRPDPDKNIHYETTKQYAAWAQGPWLSAAAGSGE